MVSAFQVANFPGRSRRMNRWFAADDSVVGLGSARKPSSRGWPSKSGRMNSRAAKTIRVPGNCARSGARQDVAMITSPTRSGRLRSRVGKREGWRSGKRKARAQRLVSRAYTNDDVRGVASPLFLCHPERVERVEGPSNHVL